MWNTIHPLSLSLATIGLWFLSLGMCVPFDRIWIKSSVAVLVFICMHSFHIFNSWFLQNHIISVEQVLIKWIVINHFDLFSFIYRFCCCQAKNILITILSIFMPPLYLNQTDWVFRFHPFHCLIFRYWYPQTISHARTHTHICYSTVNFVKRYSFQEFCRFRDPIYFDTIQQW